MDSCSGEGPRLARVRTRTNFQTRLTPVLRGSGSCSGSSMGIGISLGMGVGMGVRVGIGLGVKEGVGLGYKLGYRNPSSCLTLTLLEDRDMGTHLLVNFSGEETIPDLIVHVHDHGLPYEDWG